MFTLIKSFASSIKSIETRVYVGPKSYSIIACMGGKEIRCIAEVEFDPHFVPAVTSAQRYALAKAQLLLEQMETDDTGVA